MVLLYCPEQIAIPPTLPDILKTYAKAAIRTQPYDLLRWSAAYFRSLANNDTPMMKCRLEKSSPAGTLTKGYLRTLVQEMGRGFFINRIILQQRWKAMCLPEDDLKKFLSLCRMLNWAQVHWLKLLGVMVGSISNNLMETMTLVCELLTEDVEGGPASIPIWIFSAVYKYLANLDCSVEQSFRAGRKVLANGELEDETLIEELPYVLSTTSIRRALLDQCDELSDGRKSPGKVQIKSNSVVSFDLKDFKVFGKNATSEICLRKIENFNTLIFYIKEYQDLRKLHEFSGPYRVSEANYKYANEQEEKTQALREKHDLNLATNVDQHIYTDQTSMLKELGPPWSWIYKFTTENCIERSYNLVEECSVISDITPALSSDESFDYLADKPIRPDDAISNIQIYPDTAPPETFAQIAEALLGEQSTVVMTPREIGSKSKAVFIELENVLREAEKNNELNVENSVSIMSIICKEEAGILERAGKQAPPAELDIKLILNILKKADNDNVMFADIEGIINFLAIEYNKIYETFVKEKEPSIKESSDRTCSDIIIADHDEESMAAMELANNFGVGNTENQMEEKKKCAADARIEARTETPRLVQADGQPPLDPIEKTFEKSGLPADAAVLASKVEKEMILGLVDPPAKLDLGELDTERDNESELTTGSEGQHSRRGYISDDSSIFLTTEIVDNKKKFKICPETDSDDSICVELCTFRCKIPAYPGIGSVVTEHQTAIFLNYMKVRAMDQRGLVMPSNFRETKCPAIDNGHQP